MRACCATALTCVQPIWLSGAVVKGGRGGGQLRGSPLPIELGDAMAWALPAVSVATVALNAGRPAYLAGDEGPCSGLHGGADPAAGSQHLAAGDASQHTE